MCILFVNEAAGEEQELAPIFLRRSFRSSQKEVREDICVCNKRNKWSEYIAEWKKPYHYTCIISFYHYDHHIVENLWFINRLMLAF